MWTAANDYIFLGKLNMANVKGVHLIIAGDNLGAEAIYQKVGFGRFPVVLDNGESAEFGKESANKTAWLVRNV